MLATVESIRRVTRTAGRRGHRDRDAGAVRVHRRPADRPARRPVRWRAAPLPAAAAAARPSRTCCCSTSPPTTSTSRRSTSLEDFLDGWPGTLVVVSHDRYFLERVTDSVWALLGDGQISMLPRGVDEYLERRAALAPTTTSRPPAAPMVESGRLTVESGDSTVTTPESTVRSRGSTVKAKSGQRRGAGGAQGDRRGSTSSWSGSPSGRRRSTPRSPRTRRTTRGWPSSARSSTRWPPRRSELELEWLEAAEVLE